MTYYKTPQGAEVPDVLRYDCYRQAATQELRNRALAEAVAAQNQEAIVTADELRYLLEKRADIFGDAERVTWSEIEREARLALLAK